VALPPGFPHVPVGGVKLSHGRPVLPAEARSVAPWQGRYAPRGRHGPSGWSRLESWLELRRTLPVVRLFCVVRGPTHGRPYAPAGIRAQLHHAAVAARRRFAPHQLRHAHAVEMPREGISLIVIQRQLGHADLAIASRYLRGIDNTEIIQAVHQRPSR
jgi:integrase